MQSIRFVCKFNVRGAFYPHPGVRSPPCMDKLFLGFYLSLLVLCTVYFSYRWSLHRKMFSVQKTTQIHNLCKSIAIFPLRGASYPMLPYVKIFHL